MRDLEEGHVYLEHFRLEHKQLRQAIMSAQDVLLEVLSEGVVGCQRAAIIERLSVLRDHLESHFAREEQGGYLEEAVVRVPRLTTEVGRLEREHPKLLADLEDLIHKAATMAPEKTMARFREFKRRLSAHEAAENRLMAQGFGCNLSCDADELQ